MRRKRPHFYFQPFISLCNTLIWDIILNFQLADLALPSNTRKSDWWRRHIQPKKPSFWLFVIRDNGNMEIYFMPDMKLAYIVNNVGEGNRYLSDSMEFVPLILSQNGDTNMDGSSYQTCCLTTMPTEIFIVGLGSYSRRPLLFIRTKADLLIYQVNHFSRFCPSRCEFLSEFFKLSFFFLPFSKIVLGIPILAWPFENSFPQNAAWNHDSNVRQSG